MIIYLQFNGDIMGKSVKYYCSKQKLDKVVICEEYLNSEKMIAIENDSFNDKYSDNQRIKIEYNRIREKLNSNSDLLVKYINEFSELEEMILMLKFNKSLSDKIKVKIVELQVLCDIKVRFTSALAEALNNDEIKNRLLEKYENKQSKEFKVTNKKYDSIGDEMKTK